MSDREDVQHRMREAWKMAAGRAYEAAHGLVEDEPVTEPRAWRWRMNTRVAVTLVATLALIAALALWWPTPPRGTTVALPGQDGQAEPGGQLELGGQSEPGGGGAGAGPLAPDVATSVTVHVAGAVMRPGLYDVALGSRVADAIEAAGGALDVHDLDSLNLARIVRDGEKISVGRDAEEAGGLINLNTASAAQLTQLPGVGPVLADRIVSHREANGPFGSIDDLDAVAGVGPAVLAGLRDAATV